MITVNIVKDTQKALQEREKFQLEAMRMRLRLTSLEDSSNRLELARHAAETLIHNLEEAFVQLCDDELDDPETAIEKARKLERIERACDQSIAAWESQLKRLAWEQRQAAL